METDDNDDDDVMGQKWQLREKRADRKHACMMTSVFSSFNIQPVSFRLHPAVCFCSLGRFY